MLTLIDPAGAERIDTDLRAQAGGQGMGQRQQPALARGVGLGVRLRLVGTSRGDVDDGAVVRAQIRRAVLGQQHRTGQVDRQGPGPLAEAQRLQRRIARIGDGGVADQAVEAAELTEHLGHAHRHLALLGHVHGHEPGVLAQRLGHPGTAFTVVVGQHYLPALGDQPGTDAQANAPGRPGDQGDLAVASQVGLDRSGRPATRRPASGLRGSIESMGNSFFQAKVTSPLCGTDRVLRSGARAGSRRAGPPRW